MAETKTTIIEFLDLSEPIRTWLASSEIVYVIVDINRKLNFKGEKMRVIPTLVLRLVLNDLPPENFVSELGDKLGLSFSAAKILAQEIEERVLRPIEVPLRNEIGIDIKAIYLNAEQSAPTPPSPAPSFSVERPVPIRTVTPPVPAPRPYVPPPTNNMQFQVPQFIETESKLVGPLTLKQFIYLGVAGLISFGLFFVLKTFVWAMATILLGIIAASLAFIKYNGRPLVVILQSALAYLWKPKLYLWQKQEQKIEEKEMKVPEEGTVSKLKNMWLNLITKKPPVNKL